MKPIITVLSFLLIAISSVWTQPEIALEIHKLWDAEIQQWQNVSETIFRYNAQKEITLREVSKWTDSKNRFIGESRITYDYDDRHTTIREYRAIFFDDEFYWVLKDTSEYFLDEMGCKARFNDNAEFTQWKWEYEYFHDCLIKSATRYYKNPAEGTEAWSPYERTLYSYSNDLKTKSFEAETYMGDDQWNLVYDGYEIYDDKGNLLEEYNSSDPARLFENAYDHKNRLVHQILFMPAGEDNILTQRRESVYEHFEDENGHLVKTLLHRRYDDDSDFVTLTFLYENYCDGLVKTEEYIRNDGTRRLWYFEYDEPVDCPEGETFEVSIFPNPATSSLTVSSELLLYNTEISVFNSAGQLIRKLPFMQRSDSQFIPLGQLPNGAYFIRLNSDAHSISKHFVIVN